MEMTIGYCLMRSAWKFADKTAIVFEGTRITYDQLNRRVNRLANALLRLGVKKGDKIASMLFNSPEIIEAYYAAAKIGAITIPINFRLVWREVEYIIDQSEARVFIYDAGLRNIIEKYSTSKGLSLISVGENSYPDSFNYEELITDSTDLEVEVSISEDDLRLIMYTSGTTGLPKGAMFTHKNNLWSGLLIILAKKHYYDDIVLIVNPLFHMNSYANLIASVFMGNTMVVMKKFDALEMMKLIESETVTITSIVPTIGKRLLEASKDHHFNLESWKYCSCTGSAWTFEMKKSFMERFPRLIIGDAYGATEFSSGTLIEGHEMMNRPKSVGKPYVDVMMRIIDDRNNDCLPGQVGEILVRGPHVTQGYYNNPEATGQALQNGWYYTGDLGYFDEDGYLFFVDREKDKIVSGGENIYTLEVEKTLLDHEDIEEAAVIGVPDDEWGKVLKAYIVPSKSAKIGHDEVINFCKENLASFKKPRYIEFVESLPKNAMGKVLKEALRKRSEK